MRIKLQRLKKSHRVPLFFLAVMICSMPFMLPVTQQIEAYSNERPNFGIDEPYSTESSAFVNTLGTPTGGGGSIIRNEGGSIPDPYGGDSIIRNEGGSTPDPDGGGSTIRNEGGSTPDPEGGDSTIRSDPEINYLLRGNWSNAGSEWSTDTTGLGTIQGTYNDMENNPVTNDGWDYYENDTGWELLMHGSGADSSEAIRFNNTGGVSLNSWALINKTFTFADGNNVWWGFNILEGTEFNSEVEMHVGFTVTYQGNQYTLWMVLEDDTSMNEADDTYVHYRKVDRVYSEGKWYCYTMDVTSTWREEFGFMFDDTDLSAVVVTLKIVADNNLPVTSTRYYALDNFFINCGENYQDTRFDAYDSTGKINTYYSPSGAHCFATDESFKPEMWVTKYGWAYTELNFTTTNYYLHYKLTNPLEGNATESTIQAYDSIFLYTGDSQLIHIINETTALSNSSMNCIIEIGSSTEGTLNLTALMQQMGWEDYSTISYIYFQCSRYDFGDNRRNDLEELHLYEEKEGEAPSISNIVTSEIGSGDSFNVSVDVDGLMIEGYDDFNHSDIDQIWLQYKVSPDGITYGTAINTALSASLYEYQNEYWESQTTDTVGQEVHLEAGQIISELWIRVGYSSSGTTRNVTLYDPDGGLVLNGTLPIFSRKWESVVSEDIPVVLTKTGKYNLTITGGIAGRRVTYTKFEKYRGTDYALTIAGTRYPDYDLTFEIYTQSFTTINFDGSNPFVQYRIFANDTVNNEKYTGWGEFIFDDGSAPTISNIDASEIGSLNITVSADTTDFSAVDEVWLQYRVSPDGVSYGSTTNVSILSLYEYQNAYYDSESHFKLEQEVYLEQGETINEIWIKVKTGTGGSRTVKLEDPDTYLILSGTITVNSEGWVSVVSGDLPLELTKTGKYLLTVTGVADQYVCYSTTENYRGTDYALEVADTRYYTYDLAFEFYKQTDIDYDGSNPYIQYRIFANDTVNNEKYTGWGEFIFDNGSAPTISNIDASEIGTLDLTVSANVTDISDVDEVWLQYRVSPDGVSYGSTVNQTMPLDAGDTYNTTLSYDSINPFVQYRLFANDTVNNEKYTGWGDFIFDNGSAPTISNIDASEIGTLDLTVSANVTDISDVDEVWLQYRVSPDGVSYGSTVNQTMPLDAGDTYNTTLSYDSTNPFVQYRLFANDTVNNEKYTGWGEFIFDEGVSVTNVDPANNERVGFKTITVRCTATQITKEVATISSVQFRYTYESQVNQYEVYSKWQTMSLDSGNTTVGVYEGNFDVNSTYFDEDDSYKLQIRAENTNGLTDKETIKFFVDSTPESGIVVSALHIPGEVRCGNVTEDLQFFADITFAESHYSYTKKINGFKEALGDFDYITSYRLSNDTGLKSIKIEESGGNWYLKLKYTEKPAEDSSTKLYIYEQEPKHTTPSIVNAYRDKVIYEMSITSDMVRNNVSIIGVALPSIRQLFWAGYETSAILSWEIYTDSKLTAEIPSASGRYTVVLEPKGYEGTISIYGINIEPDQTLYLVGYVKEKTYTLTLEPFIYALSILVCGVVVVQSTKDVSRVKKFYQKYAFYVYTAIFGAAGVTLAIFLFLPQLGGVLSLTDISEWSVTFRKPAINLASPVFAFVPITVAIVVILWSHVAKAGPVYESYRKHEFQWHIGLISGGGLFSLLIAVAGSIGALNVAEAPVEVQMLTQFGVYGFFMFVVISGIMILRYFKGERRIFR